MNTDTFGIPPKPLSDKQYDRARLKHLQGLSEVPESIKPELEYLAGTRQEPDYHYHKHAKEQIDRLKNKMSMRKIAEYTTVTAASIRSIYARQFREVSDERARDIYNDLKSICQRTA